MTRSIWPSTDCDACRMLVREWLDARQRDLVEMRMRLIDTARASGRSASEMRDVWLASVARMDDGELPTLTRAYFPRTAAVREKAREHEAQTGHAVHWLVSAAMLGYARTDPVR